MTDDGDGDGDGDGDDGDGKLGRAWMKMIGP